jgi:hypothetical protein
VTATSASNAWAVGTGDAQLPGVKTLILHWNGKAWRQVPSPNPFCSTCNSLYAVAVASAHSAWAVGDSYFGNPSGLDLVVILHWNGTRWLNVRSASAPADEPALIEKTQPGAARSRPARGDSLTSRVRAILPGAAARRRA